MLPGALILKSNRSICAHAIASARGWNQEWESQMSLPRVPIDQLEPSNLLEPLDLADRQIDPTTRPATPRVDPAKPSARADRAETGATGFNRIVPSMAPSPPAAAGSRWPLKSALIVAGALACFGAGAAVQQLGSLKSVGTKPSPAVATAPAPAAATAQAPVKSEQSQPAEPNNSGSNGSSGGPRRAGGKRVRDCNAAAVDRSRSSREGCGLPPRGGVPRLPHQQPRRGTRNRFRRPQIPSRPIPGAPMPMAARRSVPDPRARHDAPPAGLWPISKPPPMTII